MRRSNSKRRVRTHLLYFQTVHLEGRSGKVGNLECHLEKIGDEKDIFCKYAIQTEIDGETSGMASTAIVQIYKQDGHSEENQGINITNGASYTRRLVSGQLLDLPAEELRDLKVQQ